MKRICFWLIVLLIAFTHTGIAQQAGKPAGAKRYLYVATPGIRDYLGYGGHGLLVFDIDNNHRFVKRIATRGLHPNGKPSNVKGIAVSLPLNSIYVSTLEGLQRIDISTEKVVWEKAFEGGCDRMAISPDGRTMYLPSLEKGFWNVVNCETGDIIKKINVHKRAHNTIYGASGKAVYMGDIASPWLHIADPKTHELVGKVGEFDGYVRPFTVNAAETMAYVTVDSMDSKYAYPSSGEVIDVKTRKIISTLTDEFRNNVASEKMVEVQFTGNKPVRAGDQFGVGRAGK